MNKIKEFNWSWKNDFAVGKQLDEYAKQKEWNVNYFVQNAYEHSQEVNYRILSDKAMTLDGPDNTDIREYNFSFEIDENHSETRTIYFFVLDTFCEVFVTADDLNKYIEEYIDSE